MGEREDISRVLSILSIVFLVELTIFYLFCRVFQFSKYATKLTIRTLLLIDFFNFSYIICCWVFYIDPNEVSNFIFIPSVVMIVAPILISICMLFGICIRIVIGLISSYFK